MCGELGTRPVPHKAGVQQLVHQVEGLEAGVVGGEEPNARVLLLVRPIISKGLILGGSFYLNAKKSAGTPAK